MSGLTWPVVLAPLFAGRSLDSAETAWAMERIMLGQTTPAQFGAFVGALRARGETAEEILGLVETMRRYSEKVRVSGPVVDTCGTGGDRSGTINVSTIAALVAAGAGARVAKHGNRAASSRCGSADLLEELGVRIDCGPAVVASCIEEAGIGFCFAPIFHPAMRHAAEPRRELGVATIFNFLGPLTNPAGATRQVIGVADPTMAPKMIEVLRRLGSEHVITVTGADGLDEISISGPTQAWELVKGEVREFRIDPTNHGIKLADSTSITGGDARENARIALDVLAGALTPARDVVLLNSAAALIVAGLADDLSDGVRLSADSIDTGRARRALDRLISISNGTPDD